MLLNTTLASSPLTPLSSESPGLSAVDGDFVGMAVSPGVRIFSLAFGWLYCVTGVFGNVLIIVTLMTQRSLRSLHNLFVGNLALADVLVVAYCVPFWLLDLALGYCPVVNQTHCNINSFLLHFGINTSVFTLVLIGFNRYLSVCRPSLYPRLFSRNKTVAFCVGTWLLSAAQGLIPFLRINTHYYYSVATRLCTYDGKMPSNPFTVLIVLNVVIATFLVGFFSFSIYRNWQSSRRRVGQWTSTTTHSQKQRAPVVRLQNPSSKSSNIRAIITDRETHSPSSTQALDPDPDPPSNPDLDPDTPSNPNPDSDPDPPSNPNPDPDPDPEHKIQTDNDVKQTQSVYESDKSEKAENEKQIYHASNVFLSFDSDVFQNGLHNNLVAHQERTFTDLRINQGEGNKEFTMFSPSASTLNQNQFLKNLQTRRTQDELNDKRETRKDSFPLENIEDNNWSKKPTLVPSQNETNRKSGREQINGVSYDGPQFNIQAEEETRDQTNEEKQRKNHSAYQSKQTKLKFTQLHQKEEQANTQTQQTASEQTNKIAKKLNFSLPNQEEKKTKTKTAPEQTNKIPEKLKFTLSNQKEEKTKTKTLQPAPESLFVQKDPSRLEHGRKTSTSSPAPEQTKTPRPRTRLSSSDMSLIRSLVLVFVLVVVLYIPIATAIALFGRVHVPADVFCLCLLCFFLNQSINWIVYGALNKNFRNGYRRLLFGRCERKVGVIKTRSHVEGTVTLATVK